MKCLTDLEDYQLTDNCRWILEASTIHLATHWHIQSLVHFLSLEVPRDQNLCRDLVKLNSKYQYTPLHVAALQDNATVITLLLNKKAKGVIF